MRIWLPALFLAAGLSASPLQAAASAAFGNLGAGPGSWPGLELAADSGEAALFEALLQRLDIEDHGDPRERRLLERAEVSFGEVPGSRVETAHTVQFLVGSNGFMRSAGSLRVVLTRSFLELREEFVFPDLTEILAHELLGHALAAAGAEDAGVSMAFNSYLGDELNANIVGWLAVREAFPDRDSPFLDEFERALAARAEQLGRSLCAPGY